MNMRILPAAVVIAGVLASATACATGPDSPPLTSGYVYQAYYFAQWDYAGYTPEFGANDVEYQINLCTSRGKPAQSNPCSWVAVDEFTFHRIKLGQFWASVAS